MNVELTRALVETRTLAQARGWDRAAAAADAVLASQPKNALLLATAPEIEVGGLPRWIAETAPALEIAKTGTEALAANPMCAGEVERLVVVFECGKLMTAAAVDVVQQICFSRPEGSYAIVLRGAENLESDEELDLLERGVFRLLVPEPKGDWHGQDLLQSACYLWSDGAARDFLAARLGRDRNALAAWLRRATEHGDALAIQQALNTLQMADREISPVRAAEQPVLSPGRLYAALNDLTEVRSRLFARIDAEAPSIERQLIASLQTLEQDLLQGLHAYLAPRLPQFDPGRDESRLNAIVTEYIASAARAWKGNAETILATRSGELQSDTDAILHGLDWAVVNAAAGEAPLRASVLRTGGTGDYPDALLENLAQSHEMGLPVGETPATIETFRSDRRRKSAIAICSMIAVAAIGQGVTMLGLGPLGLAAVGATLVGQAVKYKEDSIRLCDEVARTAIQTTFRETILAVQQQVRDNLKPVRSRVAERFRELEQILDSTLQALRTGVGTSPAEDPDRRTLADIRQRIVALTVDAVEGTVTDINTGE